MVRFVYIGTMFSPIKKGEYCSFLVHIYYIYPMRVAHENVVNFAVLSLVPKRIVENMVYNIEKKKKPVNSCCKNIIIKIVKIGARKTEKIENTYIFRVKN
jgi:hypothetical protein